MNDDIFSTTPPEAGSGAASAPAESAAPAAPMEQAPPVTPPPAAPCDPRAVGAPAYCPRCGSIAAGRFCSACGWDLAVGQPGAPVPPPYVPYPQQPYPQNGGYPPPAYPAYPAYGYGSPNYAGGIPYQKQSHRTVWLVCGLIVLFAALLAGILFLCSSLVNNLDIRDLPTSSGDFGGYESPSQDGGYYLPQGISDAELAEILPGMSYGLVTQIIGGEGTIIEEGVNAEGKSYAIYGWPSEDDYYAAVYITFTEGRATEITTEGYNR